MARAPSLASGLALLWLSLAILAPTGAAAQVLAPQTQGAVVVTPYLTSASAARVTVATVTNLDPFTPYRLHVQWIDAASWNGIDYNCEVTPAETTYFVFEAGTTPGTTRVTFECSDPGLTLPDPDRTNNIITRSLPGTDGIMFVSLEASGGPPGIPNPLPPTTINQNILIGDATVLDMAQGMAFSVPAVHIQAAGQNLDRTYLFDGVEYRNFPDALTTNYIAPDDDTTAELILFTLDGTVGGGSGVNARLTGFAFDDDENATSATINFDCFIVADITSPSNGFGDNVTREFGGHLVGHVQLFPDIALRNDLHDLDPVVGDGNGGRVTPVHGWIVQSTGRLGDLMNLGSRAASDATWARQLGQSSAPLVALGADTPGLVTD